MTVRDPEEIVQEADRLAAQLHIRGYTPSAIFTPEMIVHAWQHKVGELGENNPVPWHTLTSNAFFARMIADEKERDKLLDWDWEATGADRNHWAGLAFHVLTDQTTAEDAPDLIAAFQTYASIRLEEMRDSAPDNYTPKMFFQTVLWEGFLMGALFATDDRRDA
jgi:hypothetical protein